MEVRLEGTARDVVILSFANDGTIDPEFLPHIFDPFRGGERSMGRGDGLGLGLYIVHQIVQAHQGSIDVQSGSDGRTTFSVRMPRRIVDLMKL